VPTSSEDLSRAAGTGNSAWPDPCLGRSELGVRAAPALFLARGEAPGVGGQHRANSACILFEAERLGSVFQVWG